MSKQNRCLSFIGVWTLALLSAAAGAADTSQHKNVSGIDVYYGVVPSPVVQTHIKKHGEAPMHKKRPFSKDDHHLVVSLYDAQTSQPITNASVSASVTPLGLSPQTKTLDIMKIGDTTSYGNYFSMPAGETPYRIGITITRPANHMPVKAEFEYRHAYSR